MPSARSLWVVLHCHLSTPASLLPCEWLGGLGGSRCLFGSSDALTPAPQKTCPPLHSKHSPSHCTTPTHPLSRRLLPHLGPDGLPPEQLLELRGDAGDVADAAAAAGGRTKKELRWLPRGLLRFAKLEAHTPGSIAVFHAPRWVWAAPAWLGFAVAAPQLRCDGHPAALGACLGVYLPHLPLPAACHAGDSLLDTLLPPAACPALPPGILRLPSPFTRSRLQRCHAGG